ncbi:hypothetical protein L916_01818 [Phytophthora nicotianae]|uniref:Uncharacterized protein n=1 Tax=Phytophthora nicotianae TaxID=4792 RepID=W2JQC4_PHYNI|nr:hypothetical protein L916_01818 [Phytophthora nicotianae]
MKHATTSATLGGSRTLMEYHCHTKVIAMDYAYKTIKYNLPLLNILSLTVRTVIQGFRFDKQVAHEQNIASKFRHVLGEITADTPALGLSNFMNTCQADAREIIYHVLYS